MRKKPLLFWPPTLAMAIGVGITSLFAVSCSAESKKPLILQRLPNEQCKSCGDTQSPQPSSANTLPENSLTKITKADANYKTTFETGGTPLPADIIRLSQNELNNSLVYLLNLEEQQIFNWQDSAKIFSTGFTTSVEKEVSQAFLEQWEQAIELALEKATGTSWFKKWISCNPAEDSEGNFSATAASTTASTANNSAMLCAKEHFISAFGLRALRRPITFQEQEKAFAIYQQAYANFGPKEAVNYVVRFFLTHPSFMYRTELGDIENTPNILNSPNTTDLNGQTILGNTVTVALTPWELASALAFAVTSYPPDDELLKAAQTNNLQTNAQLEFHIARLLTKTHMSGKSFAVFVREWLHMDLLAKTSKSDELLGAGKWNAELSSALHKETEHFLEDLFLNHNASLKTLFTADYAFVNKHNAPLYGFPQQDFGDNFLITGLSAESGRVGILSQPAFLSSNAGSLLSSPIKRGVTILNNLLCESFGPPPAVPPVPEEAVPGSSNPTTRERFEAHTKQASCQGCHQYIDPIGFSFEKFDAVGRYREKEFDKIVHTSGLLKTLNQPEGFLVDDHLDTIDWLVQSPQMHRCFVEKLYQYGVGRRARPTDNQMINGATQALTANPNLPVGEAIMALYANDLFRQRQRQTNP